MRYLSGSESVQNILQGLHKDLVSYLLESKLVFVCFKNLESIHLFSRFPKLPLGSMEFDHFYAIYSLDHTVAKIWSTTFTRNLTNRSFKNSAKIYGENWLSQQNVSLSYPPPPPRTVSCRCITIGRANMILPLHQFLS